MKRPIVGLTLFFMAGIVLGRYLPFSFLLFYIFSLILFGASFSLFLKRKTPLVSFFLFSLTLLVGYLYFSFTYFPHSPAHIINFASSEGEVELVGRVVSRPSEKIFTKRKRVSFILQAERVEPSRSNQERSSQISSPDVPSEKSALYGKVEGKVWVNSYSLYQNFAQPHDQVAKSILLGDKDRLPPHILDSFRRTGTAQAVPVQSG